MLALIAAAVLTVFATMPATPASPMEAAPTYRQPPVLAQAVKYGICSTSSFDEAVGKPFGFVSQIFSFEGGDYSHEDSQVPSFSALVRGRVSAPRRPVDAVCFDYNTRAEAEARRAEQIASYREFGFQLVELTTDFNASGSTARADGSPASPLILDCTSTSGQISSLTGLFDTSPNALVKIAGNVVSIWRPSQAVWVEHPCVQDFRDGQYCSITPMRISVKDSQRMEPGVVGSNELDIDRRTGSFTFANVLSTPGVAPYVQQWRASGSCRPAVEPGAPVTTF